MTRQVAQWVKNPPEMPEMLVRSLGQEDALEKGMATHSSPLDGGAWQETASGVATEATDHI